MKKLSIEEIKQLDANNLLNPEEKKMIDELKIDSVKELENVKLSNGNSLQQELGLMSMLSTKDINLTYGKNSSWWGSEDIAIIQAYLNMIIGSKLNIDGKIGPKTINAILKFKSKEVSNTEKTVSSNISEKAKKNNWVEDKGGYYQINNSNPRLDQIVDGNTATIKFVSEKSKQAMRVGIVNLRIPPTQQNQLIKELESGFITVEKNKEGFFNFHGVIVFLQKGDQIGKSNNELDLKINIDKKPIEKKGIDFSFGIDDPNLLGEMQNLDGAKEEKQKVVITESRIEQQELIKEIVEVDPVAWEKNNYLNLSGEKANNYLINRLKSKEENKAIGMFLSEGIKDTKILEVLQDTGLNEINFYSFVNNISKANKKYDNIKNDLEDKFKGKELSREVWKKIGYDFGFTFTPWEADNLDLLRNEYNKGGIFKNNIEKYKELNNKGVEMKDYYNSKNLANIIGENELYLFLGDYNNDGVLDNNDKGTIFGHVISDVFRDIQSLETYNVVGNICTVLESAGININPKPNNKKALLELFRNNPEYKQIFQNQIFVLANYGFDVEFIIKHGGEGVRKWMEAKNQMEKNLVFNKIKETLGKDYENHINSLREKVVQLKQEKKEEEANRIDYLRQVLEKNQQGNIDMISLRSFSTFMSFVKNKEGISQSASIGSNRLDEMFRKATNGLVNGINLQLGYYIQDGKIRPGISAALSFSGGTDMSANVSGASLSTGYSYNNVDFQAGIGTFWILPTDITYTAGIRYTYNTAELESAGFVNKDNSLKKMGVMASISTLGWSVMVTHDKDMMGAINKDKEKLESYMGNVFNGVSGNDNTSSILNKIELNFSKLSLNESEKDYLKQVLENIKGVLTMYNFDNLGVDEKNNIIDNIKNAYVLRLFESRLKSAEDKGWHLSNLSAGLMFIANYFPLPILGIGFTKISREYHNNQSESREKELLMHSGAGTDNVDLSTISKDFGDYLNEVIGLKNIQVKLLKQDGKEYLEITDNSGKGLLSYINIWVGNGVKNNVQYKNGKLLIGDVNNIIYRSKRDKDGEKHYLFLGTRDSGSESINLNMNKNEFIDTKPVGVSKSSISSVKKSEIIGYGNPKIDEYINNNLNVYVGLHLTQNKNLVQSFTKNYNNGNYEESKKGLINLIKKIDPKGSGEIINIINKSSGGELIVLLAQFKDIMMTDYMTKDKILSNEKQKIKADDYLNKIFEGKNTIEGKTKQELSSLSKQIIDNPSLWNDNKKIFDKLLNYKKDQSVVNNYAKQLYFLLMPIFDITSTSVFGVESFNRSKSIREIFQKEGLPIEKVMEYRENIIDQFKGKNSWDLVPVNSMFGIVASYKEGYESGMDLIPQGVVNVAGGELQLIPDSDKQTKQYITDKLMNNKDFRETVKNAISKVLYGNEVSFYKYVDDKVLKELLENGSAQMPSGEGNTKRVYLDRDFTFFMYGRCFNEAFGVKLNGLTIEGGSKIGWNFEAGGAVVSQILSGDQTNINLGIIWGDKKEKKPMPTPSETPTETPTTIPSVEPSQPPTPSPSSVPSAQPSRPPMPSQPPIDE